MEDLNKEAVMKRASSHLRKLAKEVKKHREKERKEKIVKTILKKTPGSVSGKEFVSKYSSLMEEDLEELELTNKALDLKKEGSLSLGVVSDKIDNDGLNPLLRVLFD